MCGLGTFGGQEVICTQKKGVKELKQKTKKQGLPRQLNNTPTRDEFQLSIKGLAVPRQAQSRQGHYAARCCTSSCAIYNSLSQIHTQSF